MYLDTMQQVYSSTSKVLVDAKGQGNLLYLPLDKLLQAAGAAQRRRLPLAARSCRQRQAGAGGFQRGAATGGREKRSTFA
jgi:hypothetical protein